MQVYVRVRALTSLEMLTKLPNSMLYYPYGRCRLRSGVFVWRTVFQMTLLLEGDEILVWRGSGCGD